VYYCAIGHSSGLYIF
nr:immunoglobulin light chain junction region [Macaca mulatta]MOV66288.1 immunoglobulin light chain junction region [Macaca mulatta]MOV66623.1 immunoglobulin light chain junction region [Macaca mulatta]MOV66677.1 immunoglobulin light chain junction region [Macaca mulatta]MOV67318.1 immunoglobulin light chain junction region [Macaca mulatta]